MESLPPEIERTNPPRERQVVTPAVKIARPTTIETKEKSSLTSILPRDRGLTEYGDSHTNMSCRPA
jgi:hypothetical protein